MKTFLVDGANKSLADIIIEHTEEGGECLVTSFGFGVRQVRKIIDHFDSFTLIADASHSTLNSRAYQSVVELDSDIDGFTFKPTEKIHAKFVVIDKKTVIFTSANLSANKRIEAYVIGSASEMIGVDKVVEQLGFPSGILTEKIKKKKDREIWLTSHQLAGAIGVTLSRVSQLVKDGVIVRSEKNRFNLSAITDFIEWSNKKKKSNKSDYRDLLVKENHREKKRENDIADKLVAPVELLTEALEKSANIIMPVLESLPLEVKRNFPEVTGGQIRLVKKAVAVCRNAIADMELILDD